MISAAAEPQTEDAVDTSPPKRFRLQPGLWIAIALVFVAQVVLLFWLGNPPPAKPSQTPVPSVIHLGANASRELLALQDPTLFVLPHRDNFSGAAWLETPAQNFTPTNWTEPPRPLPLLPQQLGAAFVVFMQTNLPPRYQPEMDSRLAEAPSTPKEPISTNSDLRIEGDLARLRLLTPVHLPPQTNSDLLSSTVVQLLVDARGFPFSPVIIASSGSPTIADVEALTIAKALRFAPAQAADLGAVQSDKMITGKLIFEWQTAPPPATNTPPATP